MLAEFLLHYIYDTKFIYQATATLVTYIAINLLLHMRIRKRRHQLLKYYGIPGPEPRLLDGSLNDYRYESHWQKFNQECRQKYGKVYSVYIGDEAAVMIMDLDILKKVFFELTSSFKERTVVFIHTPLDEGILFAKYDRWRFFRKVMSPLFSSYQVRGEASTMFIEESIKLMLEYIDQRLDRDSKTKDETFIDIQDLMKATTLHMISSMALQVPIQVKEDEEHVRSLDAFLSTADKGIVIAAIYFPILKPVLEFLAKHFEHGKTLALIRHALNRRIDQGLRHLKGEEEKELQRQQKHVMDLLIRLHHEGKLTRAEIIGNAEAILFAGYDTTSTTLSYLFWVLSKYPEIQEKLRVELATHGIESEYLEQVIYETMRVYPTVNTFVTRIATETVEIGDLIIPQGAKVVYNSHSVHYDPEIWPEPTKFDPERFKDTASIHPCAFGPFGFGERKCLGYSLAMLEMKMIACDVLLKYKLKLKSPQELKLVPYAVVITKPSEKILINLERI